MRQLSAILLGLLILTSCDCYQRVTGTVTDKDTGKPIAGIKIYKKSNPSDRSETDTVGKFELSSISGGLFGCPPMKVVIEHSDYVVQEVEIPTGKQKQISLTRLKEGTCTEKIDEVRTTDPPDF